MTRPAPTVTVPVEPTEAMIEAWDVADCAIAESDRDKCRAVWSAMLAAAPAAPQAAGVGELTNEQIQTVMVEAIKEVRETVTDNVERAIMDADVARMERGPVDMGTTGWEVMRAVHRRLAALRAPSREPEGGAVDDLREALIQADLKIRSLPGTDQSDVEFIRAALATREEAPAEAGEWTVEKRFPELNDHLIRMASTGNTGSLTEWAAFWDCLRSALRAQPQAREATTPSPLGGASVGPDEAEEASSVDATPEAAQQSNLGAQDLIRRLEGECCNCGYAGLMAEAADALRARSWAPEARKHNSCVEKQRPGGCQLPNTQCNYPECSK